MRLPGRVVRDTAVMTLDKTHAEIVAAHRRGEDIARVHSGDPSLYGAIAEQIRRLRADAIPYEIIPGVPAYAAAAAAIGQELTIPEIAQSIVLTRMSMQSTGMPAGETLGNFARTGATLAIHLGVRNMREIERQLVPQLRRGMPGRGRLSHRLAGSVGHPGHACRHSQKGASREDHPHGADSGWPGAG